MKSISILLIVLSLGSCGILQKKQPEPPKFSVRFLLEEIELGEVEMQIDRPFPLSGLTKVVVKVSYFANDDAVCLTYRSDFFTYQHFWDYNSRDLFKKSLDTYMVDYENRNLHTNLRNTKSIYGTSEGFLTWQEFSFTMKYHANMGIEFGYFFRERFPYYAVTQKLAQYVDRIDRAKNTNSQEISMYFTRAQARELADLIDDAVLDLHVIPVTPRTPNIEFDVW
ncbi:MAG: hypothetical protein FWD24_08875 [Treponema sp.]|nr:hypothetical protein [Treponema sp.]